LPFPSNEPGFIARKEGSPATLWTRHGTNFTDRLMTTYRPPPTIVGWPASLATATKATWLTKSMSRK
jgi:hypothetical protein